MTEIPGYYLVKLVKGDRWRPGFSPGLFKLQIRHMLNLWRLRRMRKALIFGPVADDGDIRGIVIFRAGSAHEAAKLIETDPAVQCGRFSYEIDEIWATGSSSRSTGHAPDPDAGKR